MLLHMSIINNISDDEVACTNIRNLKHIRLQHGITLHQVGMAIGKSHTSVGRYENGEILPDINTYNKLADFFRWFHYSSGRKISAGSQDCSTLNIDFEQVAKNKELNFSRVIDPNPWALPDYLKQDLQDLARIKGLPVQELVTRVLDDYAEPLRDTLKALREIQNKY